MNQDQIVLNTLVFADQVTNHGAKQADLLNHVADFNITNSEIRREYIHDFASELPAIKKAAVANHQRLFYSVPKVLFVAGGELNPELNDYFSEAEMMGIYAIKLNVGDFASYHGDLAKDFAPFMSRGIQINVENDQTQQSGSSNNLLTFLKAVKAVDVDIKYVYDMGNWRFVGEDELVAAAKLAPFVRYIHVKNDVMVNDQPSVVALDQGVIDWQAALKLLPNDLPVAIEYPATDDEISHAIELLKAF